MACREEQGSGAWEGAHLRPPQKVGTLYLTEVRTVFGTAVLRYSSLVCLSSQSQPRARDTSDGHSAGSVRHPRQRGPPPPMACTYLVYTSMYCGMYFRHYVLRTAYCTLPTAHAPPPPMGLFAQRLGSLGLGNCLDLRVALAHHHHLSDPLLGHRIPTLFGCLALWPEHLIYECSTSPFDLASHHPPPHFSPPPSQKNNIKFIVHEPSQQVQARPHSSARLGWWATRESGFLHARPPVSHQGGQSRLWALTG